MLATFLKQRGYTLNHEGQGNYRVVGMQGLIIKEDYWYQHSQQKGGHAIQLIMQLENINFKNAKNIFENTLAFPKKAFILEEHPEGCSLKNKTIPYDTIGYLVNKRKIDKPLVIDLIKRKYISQDHHNNICFMGYDNNKNIKCISKRAISPKSPLQKFDGKGSDKRYSFSIPAEQSNPDIVLTEGPIDALSIACLEYRKNKKTYFSTHKIALCGSFHKVFT